MYCHLLTSSLALLKSTMHASGCCNLLKIQSDSALPLLNPQCWFPVKTELELLDMSCKASQAAVCRGSPAHVLPCVFALVYFLHWVSFVFIGTLFFSVCKNKSLSFEISIPE